jgi:hypothetical protein
VLRGVMGATLAAVLVLAWLTQPASARSWESVAGSGVPQGAVAAGSGAAVVVNELAVGRYVELHNISSSTVDIGGLDMWLCGSGDVTGAVRLPFGRQLAGDGYYVIAGSGFTGGTADQTYGGVLPGGGAALLDPAGYVSDGVATTANSPCGEDDPAPACPTAAIARDPAGTDTGRNAADFSCRCPSPGGPN